MKKPSKNSIRINEYLPENAAILILNWEGTKYSKGFDFKEIKAKGKINLIKSGLKSLSKSGIYTIDYLIKNKS